jgi:hypothetical protein
MREGPWASHYSTFLFLAPVGILQLLSPFEGLLPLLL